MTKEETKQKLIGNLKHSTGWTAGDNAISGIKGGQQVSLSPRGVCVDCQETGFRIYVSHSRSAIENKEWAIMVYSMYLDEILG